VLVSIVLVADAASVGAASGTAAQYIVDVVLRCASSDAAGSASVKHIKMKPCPAGQDGEMLVRINDASFQSGYIDLTNCNSLSPMCVFLLRLALRLFLLP
jgi:hypothetical protein